MRPGQQQQHQQKRMRGRNNNNNRKGPNPLSRSYESNGPDVKIRGNAAHIADKYVQLARDATSSGDPVAAENYLQHAEHYYRIVMANQPQYPQGQGQAFVRADDESRDEDGDEDGSDGQSNGYDNGQQPNGGYQQNAPQPYVQQSEGGPPRQERQPREQRDYQPREPRQQNNQNYNNGPREPREQQSREQHQPREAREQREPQGGLPAFITGGAGASPDIAPNVQGETEGAEGGFGRGRNRRRGRYGRAGGQGAEGAPEGSAPSAEPEVAPGE